MGCKDDSFFFPFPATAPYFLNRRGAAGNALSPRTGLRASESMAYPVVFCYIAILKPWPIEIVDLPTIQNTIWWLKP